MKSEIDKDTSITVCGLLKEVIHKYEPEQWAEMTLKAYNAHHTVCESVVQFKEKKGK